MHAWVCVWGGDQLLKMKVGALNVHRRNPKSLTTVRKGKCHMSHLQPEPRRKDTQPTLDAEPVPCRD